MLVSDLYAKLAEKAERNCLNPCFSGCWSRTRQVTQQYFHQQVLILVLVDVGLGLYDRT